MAADFAQAQWPPHCESDYLQKRKYFPFRKLQPPRVFKGLPVLPHSLPSHTRSRAVIPGHVLALWIWDSRAVQERLLVSNRLRQRHDPNLTAHFASSRTQKPRPQNAMRSSRNLWVANALSQSSLTTLSFAPERHLFFFVVDGSCLPPLRATAARTSSFRAASLSLSPS